MYKPELDGLRAISILLVLISHAGLGHIIPGGLGVTVFFFVSGFLITSLLIEERERAGKIDLYKFYLRRFWRLLPPLFFFLILSIVLILTVNHSIKIAEVLSVIFYFANYYKVLVHYVTLADYQYPSPFYILWSLAIEEHFYIIFSPLLAFTYKSKNYFKIVVIFLFLPLVIRILIADLFPSMLRDGGYNFCATETRIDSIAFGCFMAYIFHSADFIFLKKILLNNYSLFLSVFIIFGSLLFRDLYFRETFRYSVQNISLLVVVSNIVYGSSSPIKKVKIFLSNKLMVFIGKLSYSLYLQHWLALIIVSLLIGKVGIYATWQVSYWVLTLILSLFSYFIIEKPTIAFRKKYGSNA